MSAPAEFRNDPPPSSRARRTRGGSRPVGTASSAARRQKALPPTLSAFVVLPEVVLTMTYVVLVYHWSIWLTCTFRFPDPEEGGPARLVTRDQFALATFAHLVLFTLLGAATLRARRSAPDLRRGHYAGIGFAAVLLVMLQVLAIRGLAPLPSP